MSQLPTYDYAMYVRSTLTVEGKPPSYRAWEKALADEGYSITYRTLQRWVENSKPGQVALNHATKVVGVKRHIAKALAKVEEPVKLAADQMKVEGVADGVQEEIAASKIAGDAVPPEQAEVNIIDARIKELMEKSPAELDDLEQRARKIFNIVLTEAATRRAHVMTLIPKETAALVDAMTSASKQTLTGGFGQPPAAGDPRTIDGEIIDVTPPDPLSSAIDKFLVTEGME
jgi:hypothetical protein